MTESKLKIDAIGNKRWYNEAGKLHRLNEPAVDNVSGYKAWYVCGRRHKIGSPAVKWPNGDKEWFIHGIRHRLDGPAVAWVEDESNQEEWWINNKQLTKEQFDEHPLVIFHRLSKAAL
jgi:hypothetical protein